MMKQPQEPTFLTIGQVAEQWQVGQRTVRRWIADGNLPAYRVGGLVRVRRNDLDKFAQRVRSA